jgi:hypothetical protein
MKHLLRIAGCIGALVSTLLFFGQVTASPAGADTVLPLNYTVNASTTLAKLHQTVTVPPGSFKGSIDLTTGTLTGNLTLPPASTTVSLAGIGLAKATFELSPVKPVVGHVTLKTLAVTATAQFNVLITSLDPLSLPLNLVATRAAHPSPCR